MTAGDTGAAPPPHKLRLQGSPHARNHRQELWARLIFADLVALSLGACTPAPGPLVRPTSTAPDVVAQGRADTEAPDQDLLVPCAQDPNKDAETCRPAFQIHLDETSGMLVHDDTVHFYFGREAVHPESEALVRALAAVIRDNPTLGTVRIEVHSDSSGSSAYNLDLTQRRADALRAMMVDAGVPAARLRAIGRGEERPLNSAPPEIGRSASRRVELWVRAEDTEPSPARRPTGASPLRPIAPEPDRD